MMAKTMRGLVDDAAKLLQKLRRMQEADFDGNCTCVTCGKVDHWKNMDGGHYISRTWTRYKLESLCLGGEFENIWPQCKGCNRFDHRIHDDYAAFMRGQYGEEYMDTVSQRKRDTKKYTKPEIIEIIKYLKQQIKGLDTGS
jgi:hypothetical protein